MMQNHKYDPKNLEELMRYCKLIVKSGLCPNHVRNPADAMFLIQRGAELGLSAVSALQNLTVIKGKVTMPAATAVGIAKASEECEYFTRIESTEEKSTWETKRKGNPEPTRYTFSREDAQKANLWGSGVWNKYPKNMLDARASMNLARLEYQDVLAGVYTPEEMESVDGVPTTPPASVDGEVAPAEGSSSKSEAQEEEPEDEAEGEDEPDEVEGEEGQPAEDEAPEEASSGGDADEDLDVEVNI